MKIIEAENFSFGYKNSASNVLENISFSVNEGELVLVCGATACGKTTLLKNLKPELSFCGNRKGNLYFCGKKIEQISERDSASNIGYVMQNPENQTVSDSVRGELAFIGESLGLTKNTIRRQIAETSAYFGLEKIIDKKTAELSGGQRQLLNLAAVMTVNPKLIILDEPTAQLDPIAAGDFIRTLYRLTRELAITVIMAEHRFEDILPLADNVIFLENGSIKKFGTPAESARELASSKEISPSLPTWLRIWKNFSLDKIQQAPMNLGAGRNMINKYFKKNIIESENIPRSLSSEISIELKNIYFTYKKSVSDVICGASLKIKKGESYTLLGSNGCGKSTLMSLICGLEKPYRGKVSVEGKNPIKCKKSIGFLPQEVQSTFLCDSVGDELDFIDNNDIYDFRPFYNMHPYDLSGGQQQLLGLKKILNGKPSILILDEPTKGLDGYWRDFIAEKILELRAKGITILTVTHDMELAALISDRCGIFFDGMIASEGTPWEIFAESIFYTTNAVKTSRGIYNKVCTASQLNEICRKNGIQEEYK